MASKFLALVTGKIKQVAAVVTSAGAGDSGKIAALGLDGRWDMSLMPTGIGANTTQALASETIGVGKFVNFWSDAGVFSMRLADNSNGRIAHGFVATAVTSGSAGAAYPLDSTNSDLSTLTVGSNYWLGTAGGVLATALDETDVANVGKISQLLGVAKSATELVTADSDPVEL